MSKHEDVVRVRPMLDHAREAIEMIRHRKRADLEKDRTLELSLVRLVEIVGEPAGRVSPATCQRFPSVPWPRIVGMRNRLIHGYNKVDLALLWDTVELELPALVRELEIILEEMARDPAT